MDRNTCADKTIKGYYHQVRYACYQALNLLPGHKLACEFRNSDFHVDKLDEGAISYEVKYYSNPIGWGDSAFKNTIRNFLDLENDFPGYSYELLVSAESKDSTNIKLWNRVKNGDETGLDQLIKEIKILYISQTTSETADQVRANYIQRESVWCLNIDINSFISRVNFNFGYNIDKSAIEERIRMLIEETYGTTTIVSADLESVMFCLIDRVWKSVISSQSESDKFISIDTVLEIIRNRHEQLQAVNHQGYLNEFLFADAYFEYIKSVISSRIFFGNNIQLQERFFINFVKITDLIMTNYSKNDIINFLALTKRHKFFNHPPEDNEERVINSDLEDLLMYIVPLSLALSNGVENFELRIDNVVKNLRLNSNELGINKGIYYGSPELRLISYIKDRFIDNLPLDIEDFKSTDIIILKHFGYSKYFCNEQCDEYSSESQSFLEGILVDIADIGTTEFEKITEHLGDRSLKDYMCEYHCGECGQLNERKKLDDHVHRGRRILKNA